MQIRTNFPGVEFRTMARPPPPANGIPNARRLERPNAERIHITRGEYQRLIEILDEREAVLNQLRAAVERLEHSDEVQFTRIAQMQRCLDEIRAASDKVKASR